VPVILIVFLSFFSYIHISDNYRTVRLPEEIVVIPLEFTNVFLIPLKKGYMLFDNGYEKEYDFFLNGLKRNNIDVMDIRYIIPANGKPFGAERLKENLHKYSQEDLVLF
jgi:hypothetical protein